MWSGLGSVPGVHTVHVESGPPGDTPSVPHQTHWPPDTPQPFVQLVSGDRRALGWLCDADYPIPGVCSSRGCCTDMRAGMR